MADMEVAQDKRVAFRRDTGDNPGGGVCAGIATYLNLDVVFVRLALVIMTLTTAGLALAGYVALYSLMPAKKDGEFVAFPPGSKQELVSRAVALIIFVGSVAVGITYYGVTFL